MPRGLDQRSNEPIKIGKYDGKEYVGGVVDDQSGIFVASILEMNPPDGSNFSENITQIFTDYDSAKQFVIEEWKRRFND